jgi:DNA-directed RNA polymerase specialized sigma24 family protein
MTGFARIDPALCESLIEKVTRGDQAAWQALIEHLWPALFNIVRSSRAMGPLAKSEDQIRDVLIRLMDKLGKHEARGLARYVPWRARHADKSFEDWIRIVTSNVVRDHVREMMGDAAVFEGPSVKRLLNEFVSSPALAQLSIRPPITNAQTARELFEFAQRRLPEDQWRALVLWVEGASFEEIGAELGSLGEEAAAKLVRSAVAVLRRAFAGEHSDDR